MIAKGKGLRSVLTVIVFLLVLPLCCACTPTEKNWTVITDKTSCNDGGNHSSEVESAASSHAADPSDQAPVASSEASVASSGAASDSERASEGAVSSDLPLTSESSAAGSDSTSEASGAQGSSAVEESSSAGESEDRTSEPVLPPDPPTPPVVQPTSGKYVLNTSSKKVHLPECGSVSRISKENKSFSDDSLEALEKKGYSRCQSCLKEESGNTGTQTEDPPPVTPPQKGHYVLNTSTKKIHLPDCSSVSRIAEKNYAETDTPETYLSQGYAACKICKPFG